MQTTTAHYYSHPGPPKLSQPPIGTGASTGVSSSSSAPANTAGGGGDPVSLRVSVAHLLSRAYTLPCSAAAVAFTQLVQPIARFQLALDVLLPLFLDSTLPLQQRILVSYILYSLYAPHPIAINPFKSVLVSTFLKEKDKAVASTVTNPSTTASGYSDNEQFVWVLWKILRGDGSDIGPFTPSNLARSPVPPKLRPEYLTLEDEDSLVKFDPFGDASPIPSPTPNSANTRAGPFALEPNSKGKDKELRVVTSFLSRDQERERDFENERLADGMRLLMAARDRVLTLSEQRILTPLISKLTSPPTIVTSLDLGGMVANNALLAYLVVVGLLSRPSPQSGTNGHGTTSATEDDQEFDQDQEQEQEPVVAYLEVLRHLPPTLPSFDLMGRLLKDGSVIPDVSTFRGTYHHQQQQRSTTTVADLVRMEVLGWFIHECVEWLDRWEEEERNGVRFDGGFGIGVRNLCRFYTSLLKQGIIDSASDADTAEMKHFTLRNARTEDANRLYRLLVYPSTTGGGLVGGGGMGMGINEGLGG